VRFLIDQTDPPQEITPLVAAIRLTTRPARVADASGGGRRRWPVSLR
jgi:hypothetical protein